MNYYIDRPIQKSATRGQWKWTLTRLGVPENHLKNKHGACPICGGKDRFRWDNKRDEGTFFCNNCGSGDGFKLLMLYHGWTFPEALRKVSELLGGSYFNSQNLYHSPVQTRHNKPDRDRYQAIVQEWENGRTITDADLAAKYLRETRRIPISSFPMALRFSPTVQGWPALLAAFTNPKGQLVQVQQILLTLDGRKAPVAIAKPFMSGWQDGAMKGGAIKLYAPTDTLAVCEGPETALAFHALYGIPVWATTGNTFLEGVEIPDSVSQIIIAADNDNPGVRSAKKLQARLSEEGRRSEICIPPEPFNDFADLCASLGANK